MVSATLAALRLSVALVEVVRQWQCAAHGGAGVTARAEAANGSGGVGAAGGMRDGRRAKGSGQVSEMVKKRAEARKLRD